MATRNGEKSYAAGYNAIQLSNTTDVTYPKLENNSQPPQTPDSTDVVRIIKIINLRLNLNAFGSKFKIKTSHKRTSYSLCSSTL